VRRPGLRGGPGSLPALDAAKTLTLPLSLDVEEAGPEEPENLAPAAAKPAAKPAAAKAAVALSERQVLDLYSNWRVAPCRAGRR